MSAAKAACDHMKSVWLGTAEGEWVSMGVYSDGNHYDAPKGVVFSFPGDMSIEPKDFFANKVFIFKRYMLHYVNTNYYP